MKNILMGLVVSLVGLAAHAESRTYSWSASGDASQYANNWFTASTTLIGPVEENFRSTAENRCASLGGRLIDSSISESKMFDFVTIFRYQVSGKITCDLSEEGICASGYRLNEREAMQICRSLKNPIERDESAQCVANALIFESYRRLSFGEGRVHILSYCIKATQLGLGLEMANAVMTQGSLRSHFNRLTK